MKEMGKTGKWLKSFLTSKKDQKNASIKNDQKNGSDHLNPPVPAVVPRATTPKEKKRWSFRRSSATAAQNAVDAASPPPPVPVPDPHQEKNSSDVAATTATATADAASATEKAAAAVICLTSLTDATDAAVEEAAAIKIQSVYRSYLARKALKALRGLVKLQALARGHLVRKQATATLRCMQALITAQVRARAQRIRSEDGKTYNHRQSTHRKLSHDKFKQSYRDMEENIKIVEMDYGEFRSDGNARTSYSASSQQQNEDRMDNRMSTYNSPHQRRQEFQQISPAPSAVTDISPRTFSGHFEDYSFATAQSSPQCFSAMSNLDPSKTPFSFPQPDFADTMSYDYPLYPNYMANTKSSRAKARSQSAPKQRPEFERQPSRGRRPSVEGRGIPKGARMQRSSSQVSSAAQGYQYPWSIKLDKSAVSLRESECGSTCSVLTNANYCRSNFSYDPRY